MSYTMTFDASHKVKDGGGHAKNFFRHIARDVDLQAGFQFSHSNKNIVPDRTRLNFTRVNDGAGGFRSLQSVDGNPPSQELEDYLTSRRATVVGRKRKDAVPIRGVILQLDPKWFDDYNPDWRENGMNREAIDNMNASMAWACNEFGQQNIVGFSLHLDEYSPQLQVLVTPVTEDGRLSQKDFFPGPSDMRRQHKELRLHMEAAGYDVEIKVTERSTEHLNSSEFQAKADRMRDEAEEVEAEKATYETLLRSLGNRKINLDDREASIVRKELELAAARAEAQRIAEATEAGQRTAKASQLASQRATEEAERERDQLRTANERLQEIPPDIDRWLDKVKFAGKPAREYFNEAAARARTSRAEVQRLIDGGAETLPQLGSRNPQRGG